MNTTDVPLLESKSASNHHHHRHLLEQDEQTSNARKIWKEYSLELKRIWEIAGPTIFSRLAMFSLIVITQSYAGHLGRHDLAAISTVVNVITSITFGFLLGMASALETLSGKAYGAKDLQMLGIYLQRSWIVLFISSILMLPLFIFATPLLKLMGQPNAVADLAGSVALWLIPMHLSFTFQFTLMIFLQCQLKTAVIAVVSGVTLVVHLLLSWIIVQKFRVGIVGTALTLDFAWLLSNLGLFGYSVLGGCPQTWSGFSWLAFDGLWEFFKLSLASGFMLSLEHFYYRMLVIASGNMGDAEVALDAMSICMTVYAWEYMIPIGLFAATGVRVAIELGAGNLKGAFFSMKVSLCNSVAVGTLFFALVIAIPEKIATIFTSSTSVIKMVDELSTFLAITILINCIQPILSGVAVGFGRQASVAYVNIGSYYLVGVPLGIIFRSLLKLGFKGMWAGLITGTVVQTLILFAIVYKF